MAMQERENLTVGARGVFIPTALVAIVAGGIWYAAMQHAAVQALTVEVTALKAKVDQRTETELAIDKRLARVEILLETIASRLQREDTRPGGPR
ncbi:MAG: hypothetical protein ACOVN0_18260 [Niveispirillum sp.]|uniref:hypothetical protein n=1 Tax=Niveispirillum sp. TaxID=1917217 RepID=UPI003BA73B19